MMSDLFMPITNGFWQATYSDQQGTSLPGTLVNAGDINLADGATCRIPDGTLLDGMMTSGSFCMVNFIGVNMTGDRVGVNNLSVTPFTATTIPDTSSLGIVVRTQQMRTGRYGISGCSDGDVATVIRTDRIGARIWVWVDKNNAPSIGSRNAYITTVGTDNELSYMTTVQEGNVALFGFILYGVDQNTHLTTSAGKELVSGLIELTTVASDYDRAYSLTI
jgi:hypothetical protein